MKKIALTQRLAENASYSEIRDALDIRWAKFLHRLGVLPILLPTTYSEPEKYFQEISVDGIILTGGNDLGRFTDDPLSKTRDDFEKKLIRYAVNRDIPLFGVCRGMQIISEFFGAEFTKRENHSNKKHAILPDKGSRYFEALQNISSVNSYHNYALSKIPDKFLISARSEDGSIEAMEHKTLKIFAQMWHSEREDPFREQEILLFRNFFQ